MAQMVAAAGLPLSELSVMVSGLLILLGGASILLGAWPRARSWLIIIFLLVVTPLAHGFWANTNPGARADDINNFSKNVALLGGAMIMLIVPQPWPYSIADWLMPGKAAERV
jgi:putative oxidoreductase